MRIKGKDAWWYELALVKRLGVELHQQKYLNIGMVEK
jgi:hypothetical protein